MSTKKWEWELYWDYITIDGLQPMSAAVRMGFDYRLCKEFLCFNKRAMNPETLTLFPGVSGSRKHLKGTEYDDRRRERLLARDVTKDFEE